MNPITRVLKTLLSTTLRQKRRRTLLAQSSLMVLSGLLILGLCSPNAHAQAYHENTLYSFSGTDGQDPMGSLTNVNGTLYGTTYQGGANNVGSVFSIDASGHLVTLHSFTTPNNHNINTDGFFPVAGLTNVNGTLYGATQGGGASGNGTIFSIDTSGNLTTLYSFSGNLAPGSALTYVDGTLYGTSTGGGASGNGAIFAIKTDGTGFQILYSFAGSPQNDGTHPEGGLINVNGTLYGTTQSGGGPHGDGTVFAIKTDGTGYQNLHSFSGTDGAYPSAGLTNINGILYGTTEAAGANACGTIFSIDTSGHLVTLYSFVRTGASQPTTDLLNVNGILYGTTSFGGTYNDGAVFSINPDGTGFQNLHSFSHYDPSGGTSPQASLININGILYGTTTYGGAYSDGTVFALIPGPTAKNDTYAPKYQTPYVVKAPGVLGNDVGDDTSMTASLVAAPTHGTLTLNADGSFTYTPANGFVGADSFTYQAVNAQGSSNTATVTLNVYAAVPLAKNDTYAPKYATAYVVKAPGVLTNDTNYDTSAMTAALVTNPSHGTLTFNSDGSFTYTPAAGFVGADSFTYKDTNAIGDSNTATVTLNVYAAAPLAKNDSYAPRFQTAYAVNAPGVLANDYTGGSTTTAVLVTNPSHGSVTLGSDGSFTYTPAAGYIGADSFTYQAVNAIGTSNTATVTLNVQTSTPIARSDSGTVTHNTILTVAAPGVLGNDYTGGSTPLTAAIVTQPAHGTVTLNSNGSYVYTPNAGFIGTDSFTYQVANPVGAGTTAPGTLHVQ